jgi:hypothetical protein
MSFASSNNPDSTLHPKLTIEHYIDDQVFTIPFTVSGMTDYETDDWDVKYADGRDKAYLVYVPNTLTISATTCSSFTNYDSKLEIFKADKSSTGHYNDDYECEYDDLSASLIGVVLTPGYYYFVVDGYDGDVGNFQLSVTVDSYLKNATIKNEALIKESDNSTEPVDIVVYPNPVCEEVNIILPAENATISILDINGRILKTHNCLTTKASIKCSDLIQGIYFIKVETSKSVVVSSFKKQ